VTGASTEAQNAVVVIQGVMSAEVDVLLTRRAGQAEGPRQTKSRARMAAGLAWLAERVGGREGFSYVEVCGLAMWDHLLFYETAAQEDAPAVEAWLAPWRARPSVAQSAPT